jgi:uncharacterized membrane protein
MEIEKQREQISGPARWLSLIWGSAAVYWGLKRRSWLGSAVALAGARYALCGITGERNVLETLGLGRRAETTRHVRGIKIRRSVTIEKSPEELYAFWKELANLPRFMKYLESLSAIDEKHSHWVVTAPAGRTVQWDAETVVDRPGEIIGWRSVAGDVDHAGSVRFERAAGGRGTVVRLQLQFNPPPGKLASSVARLFGRDPDRQIRDDLARFKQLVEAGEIATTEGQTSGRVATPAAMTSPALAEKEAPEPFEPVEEASEQSFPASDAPSWAAGGGR